jgi:hypothetical protein
MISPLRFTTNKSKFNCNNDVVAICVVFVYCLAVFLSNEVVVCFSTSRSSKNNKAPTTATSTTTTTTTTTTSARLFSTPSPSYYSDQQQHASSLSQGESLVLGVGSFSTGSFTAQQQPLWMGKNTHKNTQAATATATISKASAVADGSSAIVSSGSHDRFTAPSLKRGNY